MNKKAVRFILFRMTRWWDCRVFRDSLLIRGFIFLSCNYL